MFNGIINYCKKMAVLISEINKKSTYVPIYRIVEIIKSDDEEYQVRVQLIHKNITFLKKPEDVLADDLLVDQFSPRDIRTLTYLGYLGINSPKYKILAQRLSQDNDKLIFALKQKGHNKVFIKTAEEIVNEQEILSSLDSRDASLISYTVGTESIQSENRMKKYLHQQQYTDERL